MNIKVCDMIMGAGKTSAAINQMINDTESKYIFITPYLNEVERIKRECSERSFQDPINFGDGKLDGLHALLSGRRNIASTHALFKRYNETTIELIKNGGYKLILDEVADVVETIKISNYDLNMLINENKIVVSEDGSVSWIEEEYEGKFDDLREMIVTGRVILYHGCMMLWTFPIDVFDSFKDVIILTYMFDAQKQKYYFDMNGVSTTKIGVLYQNNSYVFSNEVIYPEYVKNIGAKIHIVNSEKLNEIGNSFTDLSSSWYKRDFSTRGHPKMKKLKLNLENIFKNIFQSESSKNIWTTFTSYKSIIKGKGYTKGFLACNARATNEYRERKNLAYCINVFYNPLEKSYFLEKGVDVQEDMYALSEMIQWIWRSAIRDGNDINIYIPSSRMRNLLIDWMDSLNSLT